MPSESYIRAKIEIAPYLGDSVGLPDRVLEVHALEPVPSARPSKVYVSDAGYSNHDLLEAVDMIENRTGCNMAELEILVALDFFTLSESDNVRRRDYLLTALHDMDWSNTNNRTLGS